MIKWPLKKNMTFSSKKKDMTLCFNLNKQDKPEGFMLCYIILNKTGQKENMWQKQQIHERTGYSILSWKKLMPFLN